MEEIAKSIGYVVMAAGGGIIAIALFLGVYWASGVVGRDVFKRIRRIYHLTVIGYWLDRLEKGGLREFQKAEEYDADLRDKGVVLKVKESAK